MHDPDFSASGKLLLFGEYFVLRGAQSIVMPLRYEQTLSVSPHTSENIRWQCFENGNEWLDITLSPESRIINTSDEKKATIVQHLLNTIKKKKPSLKILGLHFHFEIDFKRNYGFGTSSTFISLLSQWSGVNPYLLLEKSFGGSGFDIAAATATEPFIYQADRLHADAKRQINPVRISKNISNQLLFVYTGKKQRSRDEVMGFEKIVTPPNQIAEMNHIIEKVLSCEEIRDFEEQMNRSELLLSTILNMRPVKLLNFSDYPYSVKSLGAWGGDFIMATFRDETKARNYFSERGMHPIFNYQQLIRE